MAFGKSVASTEGFVVRRYTGVGSVFVKGVNPNKEELSAFYGREMENEPEYLGTSMNGTESVPRVRVQFLLELDNSLKDQNGNPKYVNADGSPINDFKSNISFVLTKAYRYNKDRSKVQVIDRYGYSGWATPEQVQNHSQLLSNSGMPLRITTSYRPAYMGEVELVEFIKTYLGIEEARAFIEGKWVNNPRVNLVDCECCLEHVEDYFKGDYSELKLITTLIPTNKIKVLFGVRTMEDGRLVQTSYNSHVLKNSVKDYSTLDKEIQEAKAAGRFATTDYDCAELHEYTVESTTFDNSSPAPAVSPWEQ